MKILGIVGSMRKNRFTNTLVERVIAEIEALNPPSDSEIVYTADLQIRPYRVVCSAFCIKHPYRCSIDDDLSDVLFESNPAA